MALPTLSISGFVLVPIEPTKEMLAAAPSHGTPEAIWAAMVAMRPARSAEAAEDVVTALRQVRSQLSDRGCDVPPELMAVLPSLGVNRRNPTFWGDLEVRRLVVELHRQVSVKAALQIIAAQVSEERTPSKSALARAWKRLDLLQKTSRRKGR